MKIKYINIVTILLILSISTVKTIDNPHFYKAAHFFEEPRFEQEDLNSIQFWFGGGLTSKGYNCNKDKVNILQIYGNENIKQLANGVPEEILNKYPKTILNDIFKQKSPDINFGKFEFCANFKLIEFDFDLKKNFSYGIFTELQFPVRSLEIEYLRFNVLSNSHCAGKNINYTDWTNFIFKFKENMKKFDINIHDSKEFGIGDTSLLLGFTKNYEETTYLDYIDFTCKVGLLLPTGKKRNIDNPFSIPIGYNGHLGFINYYCASVGLYEWLTFGAYANYILFADKTSQVRIKTAADQSGFIKLVKTHAKVDQGTIWSLGTYLKLDHMLRGLSVIAAYRFDQQNRSKLKFGESSIFNSKIANSDPQLLKWNMNTVNVIIEYDCATFEEPNMPKFEIFFDLPINGIRIFKTKVIGFGINLDYCW